jgi:hypothetical protein
VPDGAEAVGDESWLPQDARVSRPMPENARAKMRKLNMQIFQTLVLACKADEDGLLPSNATNSQKLLNAILFLYEGIMSIRFACLSIAQTYGFRS